MTRRSRFSPFLAKGVFAGAAILAGATHVRAGDVAFVAQPPITTAADGATSAVAADMDGDGDLDVVAAASQGDAITWHENTAGDGSAWTTHTIATGADNAFQVVTADVDRDADMDVVSASTYLGVVAWHENTAGDGSAWATHAIDTAASTVSVFAADVDGDGDVDVISASDYVFRVVWHENTAGDGSAWTTHTISTGVAPWPVFAADIDRDGDLDVVSTLVDEVVWYENAAGDGSAWTPHTVETGAVGVRAVVAADVDRDGDPDLVSVSVILDTVVWHENVAGDGSAWSTHTVSTGADGPFQTFAADVDGDGDLDLFSASATDDTVAWYENTAGNGSAWTTHTLATTADGAHSVVAADLDRDGDLDVLATSTFADTVAWYRNETLHGTACFPAAPPVTSDATYVAATYAADLDGDGDTDAISGAGYPSGVQWHENVAGDGSAWVARPLEPGAFSALAFAAADVDGDGDLDVFSAPGSLANVTWNENLAGDGSAWAAHAVSTGGYFTRTVSAADVDGDGDIDAISASFYNQFMLREIVWYENVVGDGSSWTTHTISTGPYNPHAVAGVDVDGDGDIDVVCGAAFGPGMGWFENAAGDGSAWTLHTISDTTYGVYAVTTGDVDGDGDVDAFSAPGANASLSWFENAAGDGSAWNTKPVYTTGLFAQTVAAADLDGDGDLDALAASSDVTSGELSWHENAAGDGSVWNTHTVTTAVEYGTTVFAADLDRDGRMDFLSTSFSAHTMAWHPNRGGQFSLTATDAAPPVAGDAQLVAMLKIDASHLGRAGDRDLELASLGLLFEETPGDVLTSAEANALFESLRVYRDANGNGIFEPGTDVLVTSLPDLVLAGGVQVVVLPDDDPGLQVGFGAPRTFFVVVETAPNASQQSPDRFRVTHLGLGPSASTAENRDFDLPLQPACPADQSSKTVVTSTGLPADVSATKAVSGRFHEGEPVTYSLVLTNTGGGPQADSATDELQDTLPSSLSVTGADDGGHPGTVSVAGNDVRWNGILPPGSSVTVSIQATINAGTVGTVVSNQGTVTYDSDGDGIGDATRVTDDPALPGAADPTSFTVTVPVEGDLVHGSVRLLDLAASGGPDVDLFGLRQEPRASYEVLVDGTTGDIGNGSSGPALDLVAADGSTEVQASTPAGSGFSRSLRFENATAATVLDRIVRIRSQGCTTGCTAEDRYRLRAWETTLDIPRLNNGATQVTVLVLQNTTAAIVAGNVWLRDSTGALAASVPFGIAPHGSIVLNTSEVAPGVSGSLTVSHDAPHGGLAGKGVAVEPATGFTFDTPLLPRPR